MFKLKSQFSPAGDQPKAIKQLTTGLENGVQNQVLLGVTGSGKTFTIAHVIKNLNRPTIILSHNKTLAAQLYSELKELFPENRIEYFVSYFDYYRPEAYMPKTDTFIHKESKSNWDLEAMRISATNALLVDRSTIVVASVASIYGKLPPKEYAATFFDLTIKTTMARKALFLEFIKRNYKRNNLDLAPGTFRSRGDVIELAPGWTGEYHYRIELLDDTIEKIVKIESLTGIVLETPPRITVFPADEYTMKQATITRSLRAIKEELLLRIKYFKANHKLLEAQRIEERVNHDLESLEEFGLCPGIENYSRHMDGRSVGERPYTLLDYLPQDGFIMIDESHMMIPQLNAMYNGDRARKLNLVNYGFRLPSALDNRPLMFHEFAKFKQQKIYISATPAPYEIDQANGVVVRQVIRPTGLLDPQIEVVTSEHQVEKIFDYLASQKNKNERTFILTTTIRVAEELTRHLQAKGVQAAYLHNELKTFQRSEVLRKLRKGIHDVVIGINLLREGIDVPEVSLILVLDADKESFFRSVSALTQIVGRASRNVEGKVIFFADKMSKSMQATMAQTSARRQIQDAYNVQHNVTPQTIIKPIAPPIHGQSINHAIADFIGKKQRKSEAKDRAKLLADLRVQMLEASKKLEFERAAQIRDLILELQAK